MYSKILVPMDTSYENAEWMKPVLDEAWAVAHNSAAEIHVVSVVPENLLKGFYPDVYSEEVAEEVGAKLNAAIKTFMPNVDVKTHVVEGGICSEILRIARELPADLIVMASHGPLMRDYVTGSNASHVALHAPCSVFIVRPTEMSAAA